MKYIYFSDIYIINTLKYCIKKLVIKFKVCFLNKELKIKNIKIEDNIFFN